jgi:hypothetical protein
MAAYEPILMKQVTDLDEDKPGYEQAEIARAEMAMAQALADVHGHYYPGYMWGVRVDSRQQIAVIQIAALMRATQGFVVYLTALQGPNDIAKWCKAAGGEILERFRLNRGAIQADKFMTVRENRLLLPRKTGIPT